MPRLNQIFRGIAFRDQKLGQCQQVRNIDELPFIKRCKKAAAAGLTVCLEHAYSVTYKCGDPNKNETKTKYFNSRDQAEFFRTQQVPLSWTATNYKRQRD